MKSDVKFKEKIEELNSQESYNIISNLNPYIVTFKKPLEGQEIRLIAQEVNSVNKLLTRELKKSVIGGRHPLGINLHSLVCILVKAFHHLTDLLQNDNNLKEPINLLKKEINIINNVIKNNHNQLLKYFGEVNIDIDLFKNRYKLLQDENETVVKQTYNLSSCLEEVKKQLEENMYKIEKHNQLIENIVQPYDEISSEKEEKLKVLPLEYSDDETNILNYKTNLTSNKIKMFIKDHKKIKIQIAKSNAKYKLLKKSIQDINKKITIIEKKK